MYTFITSNRLHTEYYTHTSYLPTAHKDYYLPSFYNIITMYSIVSRKTQFVRLNLNYTDTIQWQLHSGLVDN